MTSRNVDDGGGTPSTPGAKPKAKHRDDLNPSPQDIDALVERLEAKARRLTALAEAYDIAKPEREFRRRSANDLALAAESLRRLSSENERLRGALETVSAIRPVDWDDDEDAEQAAAWKALDEALSNSPSPPGEAE